jgi:uncharacterized membrane protein (Fun14 family)
MEISMGIVYLNRKRVITVEKNAFKTMKTEIKAVRIRWNLLAIRDRGAALNFLLGFSRA